MNKSVLGLVAVMAMGACGTQQTPVDQGSKPQASDIFAGFEVQGKSWDAVGSIGLDIEGHGYVGGVCTATLIGGSTVLSAKHCSDGIFGVYGDMYFAPGSENAQAPAVKYKIVATETATPKAGGSMNLGADVSVFFLDDAVLSPAPMPVATEQLTDDDARRVFFAIGYGTQNNSQDSGAEPTTGLRKLGKITLNAVKGGKYQLLFGTHEAFMANLEAIAPTVFGFALSDCLADEACAQSVEDLWNTQMTPDYEAYLGNNQGDAQTCHGDSGGPLVGLWTDSGAQPSAQATKPIRKVYGVVSNGWFAPNQACYGSYYATFGPLVQPWLAKAQTWVDPCGDLTVQGSCNGSVAVRCTSPGEGDRRVAQLDCAALGQVCATLGNGLVGCTDDGATPGNQAQPAPAPAPGTARATIDAKFMNLASPAVKAITSFKKK